MSNNIEPIDGGTKTFIPVGKSAEGNGNFQFILGFVDLPEAEGVNISSTGRSDDGKTLYYQFDFPNLPAEDAKIVSYPLPVICHIPKDGVFPEKVRIENASDKKKHIKRKIIKSKPGSPPDPIAIQFPSHINAVESNENMNEPWCQVLYRNCVQPEGPTITYYFILTLSKTDGTGKRNLKTTLDLTTNEIVNKYKEKEPAYGKNIASYSLVGTQNTSDFDKVSMDVGGEYNTVSIDYPGLPFDNIPVDS